MTAPLAPMPPAAVQIHPPAGGSGRPGLRGAARPSAAHRAAGLHVGLRHRRRPRRQRLHGALGTPASGQFFLGAFGAADQLLGSIGCERAPRAQQRHCAVVADMMVAPHAQRLMVRELAAAASPVPSPAAGPG